MVKAGDLFAFYGLLKQAGVEALEDISLQDSGEFLGACSIRGQMLNLGDYPGLVEGESLVSAELYRVNDTAIVPLIDAFEDFDEDCAVGSMYIRKQVDVLTAQGQSTGQKAWVYWYNLSAEGHSSVEDGVWPVSGS
jgi:gamma-glutamylcyclotransferase (GGCT)/AIG2-like uncharacterized protein YtfP